MDHARMAPRVLVDELKVEAIAEGLFQVCTTAHPLRTIFTNIFGASISEATMRPNPVAR
jgi:hypothetical protein